MPIQTWRITAAKKVRAIVGVISLLQELGRELDLVLTAGSIERARNATQEAERRRELVEALEEALGELPDLLEAIPDEVERELVSEPG